jgi:deoxyinosine 3'endonuclease (endonuclease V)
VFHFEVSVSAPRVGIAKKYVALDVIVVKQTPPGTFIIAEKHAYNQMTLLTGISAFRNSIPPLFISKSKTFEAERLDEQ